MSTRGYPANTWRKSIDMKKGPNLRWSLIQCSGGDEGDRTPDLLTASQALSQLSYAPCEEVLYGTPRRCKDNFRKYFAGGGEGRSQSCGRGAGNAAALLSGRSLGHLESATAVFRFRGAGRHPPNGHPAGAGPIIGANRAPADPAISKPCRFTGLGREPPSMPQSVKSKPQVDDLRIP